MRHQNFVCSLFVILMASSYGAYAASGFSILPPPKKVAGHSYAWIGPLDGPSKENQGYRMNMGFVVGKKAVAVIDSGYTEAMAKEMIGHIRTLTPLPIRYVINTNSQAHRFMGNTAFKSVGAELIAHPLEVKRMNKDASAMATGIERILKLSNDSARIPAMPTKLVSEELALDLGDLTISIKHLGAAHTPAPLVVHVPADKLVFAGDILYSGRLLAVTNVSNTKAWINTFDKLKHFGGVLFVPGHGQPAGLADFKFPTRDYLALLYTHMQKMVDDGVDLQDAMEKLDQSAFSKLANYKLLAGRNASWAYLEREAEFFK